MEVSWSFPRSGRYRGHRQKPGVAEERPQRIGSRRAIEKEQRHSSNSCCQRHCNDGDHHHRRQCRSSSSTTFARALSAIAVFLVLFSSTGTASTVATAAAAAATTATAIHDTRSPSGAAAAAGAAASPAGQDHAVSAATTFETEADPAVASSAGAGPITASSAELGSIRASRKPPPLLCPWDRSPAAAFLVHAVDERDDERGESATFAATCASGGGGGGDGEVVGVGDGDGGGGGGGGDGDGDGAVGSSPTFWRSVEQEFDTGMVEQKIDTVEHDFDNVGQEEAPTAASASDPPIAMIDIAPPSAAAAAADGGKREVVVSAKQAPSPTALPTEEDAKAGPPLVEALANRKERELNAEAVNSAARRARAGESVEESVDAGESIDGEGGAGGGGWGWRGETAVAAAPSEQIGGGGSPTTITDTDAVADAAAVSASTRRGSGRTPLAKTGGCGSKGPSPALGSWAEEQGDDGEEGGLPLPQGGGDRELGRPSTDRNAHAATAEVGASASALGNGPAVSDGTVGFAEPPGEGIDEALRRDGRDLDDERRRLAAETTGLPRESVVSEGQEEAVSVGGRGGDALDARAAVSINGGGVDDMFDTAGSALLKPDVPTAECVTTVENGDGSESAPRKTCDTKSEAGQRAGQGLVSEPGAVEKGAHEEPVKSDDLFSTRSGPEAREDVDGVSTQSGRDAGEDVDVEVGPGLDEQDAVGAAASATATLELGSARQSDVPEMSPTLSTRTGFHESGRPRAEGIGPDAEETEEAVFEGGGGEGEDGGTQQETTTSSWRRVKGGWGWSAPGWGKGKEGFAGGGDSGGGGGGDTDWLKGNKVVGTLVVLLMGFVMLAQGTLPRWVPIIGGDHRSGWGLDLPPPGSRRGSLLSGMGSDGLGGRFDEPPMPDLVSDDEPEMASSLPRVAANAAHGGRDLDGPLKWDTRPKGPDHLVFHHILGVVPTGVLNAWKHANRSGKGGGGGVGGVVGGGCAASGRAVQGSEASVGRGGGSGDGNDSANGAPSTRRGGGSSSSSACTAGNPPAVGWKAGKRHPLPPVRYTPEWHAWCAARGEADDRAVDRAEERAEERSEERNEEVQLQVFQLYEASCVTASEDRKVAAGDGVGVGVGVEMGVGAAVLDVGVAAPQPQKKSTTPVAIGLQSETPAEAGCGDQVEGGRSNGGGGVSGGGSGGDGGGDHEDGNFSDEISVLSAPASAHPPPMVSRVA